MPNVAPLDGFRDLGALDAAAEVRVAGSFFRGRQRAQGGLGVIGPGPGLSRGGIGGSPASRKQLRFPVLDSIEGVVAVLDGPGPQPGGLVAPGSDPGAPFRPQLLLLLVPDFVERVVEVGAVLVDGIVRLLQYPAGFDLGVGDVVAAVLVPTLERGAEHERPGLQEE
ncbi:hypothetical protein CTA1_12593 [Colletotrichum tanaceti]|uniref:Uncharacterized protein n=1 Tax=Colletotrichum tanaceti TaxID=1306861 RepID=A0A4U6XCE1_9PEZI|nr:hypothetical protein CTA1_12593 [Colletotrichum tanaceti]